ncbi:MAG: hypothetical protein WB759_01330, partial [Methanoregula sp.]
CCLFFVRSISKNPAVFYDKKIRIFHIFPKLMGTINNVFISWSSGILFSIFQKFPIFPLFTKTRDPFPFFRCIISQAVPNRIPVKPAFLNRETGGKIISSPFQTENTWQGLHSIRPSSRISHNLSGYQCFFEIRE